MKFKIAIASLALVFISASALGTPNDNYFFPGGTWQGNYMATCNNVFLTGEGSMYVQPLSITNNGSSTIEYFAGIITLENVPKDCVDVDFSSPVNLAKGTKVTEFTNSPPAIHILFATNAGTITPFSQSWFGGVVTIQENNESKSNSLTMSFAPPN